MKTQTINPTLNDIYLMLINHIGYTNICNDFIVPKDKIITNDDYIITVGKLKSYFQKHFPICLDYFLLTHEYTNIKGEVLKTTSDINEFYNILAMDYNHFQEHYYEPTWTDKDQWDENGELIHPDSKTLYSDEFSTPELKEYFNPST